MLQKVKARSLSWEDSQEKHPCRSVSDSRAGHKLVVCVKYGIDCSLYVICIVC